MHYANCHGSEVIFMQSIIMQTVFFFVMLIAIMLSAKLAEFNGATN
jgi:hypothetical protein